MSRDHIVSNYLMTGTQKSVDGNQHIGAVAIYFNDKMGYDNSIERDLEGNIVLIRVSGCGGRTQNVNTGLYESTFNQPLGFNLAMLSSAAHSLPIRVLYDTNNNITYLGLWQIIKSIYEKQENKGSMKWIFTLVKAVSVITSKNKQL